MQPLPLIQLAGELHRITTPHVIIGGLAAATYLPGRVTEDLDLLIHAPTADRLRAELDQFGATWRGRLAVGGATYQLPSGLLIDVIESTAPWVPSASRSPRAHPVRIPDHQAPLSHPAQAGGQPSPGRRGHLRDPWPRVGSTT